MSDPCELRQLHYFVALAEELHFTRAARRLQISQQALSASVARLERDVGVKLLDRNTRSVRLTPAGSVLLVRARVALGAAADAITAARQADEPAPAAPVYRAPTADA